MEKARILIVEDEELVALSMLSFLEGLGHLEVKTVASGEEALELVPEFAPDLVLMDMHLAGEMSGAEAARRISASFRTPIVYLTAYSDETTVEAARAARPYGYLVKPIDERSLQTTIEMALLTAGRMAGIREENERMETVLGSMEEGIVVTGLTGKIGYMNPGAATLLGTEPPLPETRSLSSLFTLHEPASGAVLALHLEEIIFGGKTRRIRDCELRTASGAARRVDMEIAPFRGRGGRIEGMVFTFREGRN